MSRIITLCVALCFTLVPGSFSSPYGTCKTLTSYTPVHFFEVDDFAGKWYLKEWYYKYDPEHPIVIANTQCYTWTVKMEAAPKIVGVSYHYQFQDQEIAGVANYTTENGVFPLASVWSAVGGVEQTPISPYTPIIWVQTDFENWAIGYDCINIKDDPTYGDLSFESMKLYTRDPLYDDEKTLNLLHTVIQNYGYNSDNLGLVDNTDCKWTE